MDAPPRPNRREVKSLPLDQPIQAFGEEVSELAFFAPTGHTTRTLLEAPEETQALALVAELTALPGEILDTLTMADTFVAIAIAGDLVEKQFNAAREKAQALGIEIGPAPVLQTSPGSASPEPEEVTPDADEPASSPAND